MNFQFVYPMFAQVLLTAVIAGLVIFTRFSAVRSKKVDARYFKTFSFGEAPDNVLKTGRHFSNLFEVPVLFYAACTTAIMLGLNSRFSLFCAWLFVVARLFHAYIHLGKNKIWPRFFAFGLGLLAVFALWLCILFKVTEL